MTECTSGIATPGEYVTTSLLGSYSSFTQALNSNNKAGSTRVRVEFLILHDFDNIMDAEAFARIECHFFYNKGFFKNDGWILDNLSTISNIPLYIVQGRYDVVCPIKSAWDLHRKMKHSKLYIIKDAGHSMLEFGIQKKLIEITNHLD